MAALARAVRAVALIVVLLAVFANADAALAHASLLRSEPADRAVVAQTPDAVTLTFNEPVSPLAFRLVGAEGRAVDVTGVTAADASITVRLPGPLPRGTHLLSWRVISADGHPVGGALTFSVGEPGAAPPSVSFESARLPLWAGKLSLYVALFMGVGGAFYAVFIARRPMPSRRRRLIDGALALGLIAAALTVGLQGADVLAVPLRALVLQHVWAAGFVTSYGATASIAACALLLALGALRMPPDLARWPAALALIGAGAALSASGHAGTAEPQWLMRLIVFMHGVTVAFWLGALVPLWAAMRSGEDHVAELLRFSRAIPVPVGILLASGLVLAVVQVGAPEALWATGYGLVLSGKIAAVIVLLALALTNRRLTPHVAAGDAHAIRRLGRMILCEIAVVLVILGLVACWRFTPPPRILQIAALAPVSLHIHTEKAMADLRFEPPRDGLRSIAIHLLDGGFGPLAAQEVTLVLAKPDAGIEPLRLRASRIEGAAWRVDGAAIPLPGRWRVRVEILVSDFDKLMIEDDVDLPR